MTEAQLQSVVIDLARLRGWLVHHTRAARRQSGSYSTPIQGHAGFPDLVLARRGRVLFVELKTSVGRLRPGQVLWGATLATLEGPADYHLWRPEQWLDGTIDELLT